MLNAKEKCITLDNYFFNFAPRVIWRDDSHSFLFLSSYKIVQYIIIQHNNMFKYTTIKQDLTGIEGFIIPYKIEEDYIDEDCSIENIIYDKKFIINIGDGYYYRFFTINDNVIYSEIDCPYQEVHDTIYNFLKELPGKKPCGSILDNCSKNDIRAITDSMCERIEAYRTLSLLSPNY